MKRERRGQTRLASLSAKFRILIGALHERSHMLLRKQGIRLAFYGQSGFVIGCALKAHHRRSSRTGALLEKLTVNRLFEQIGEEKSLLKILADGHRAVSLDNHHWMILELRHHLFRLSHRRRVLWNNRDLPDSVFLLKTDRNKTLMA